MSGQSQWYLLLELTNLHQFWEIEEPDLMILSCAEDEGNEAHFKCTHSSDSNNWQMMIVFDHPVVEEEILLGFDESFKDSNEVMGLGMQRD